MSQVSPYYIKQLRTDFGFTQEQMARRIGIPRTTYGYVETGRPSSKRTREAVNGFLGRINTLSGKLAIATASLGSVRAAINDSREVVNAAYGPTEVISVGAVLSILDRIESVLDY